MIATDTKRIIYYADFDMWLVITINLPSFHNINRSYELAFAKS